MANRILMAVCILIFSISFVGCASRVFALARVDAAAANASFIHEMPIEAGIEGLPPIVQTPVIPSRNAGLFPNWHEIFVDFITNLETEAAAMNNVVVPDNGDYIEEEYTEEEEQIVVGHIAITFDDGPHPTLTPVLLDALYARDVRVTFFLLGMEVDRYPDIVARMYEEGHLIGNHSFGHPSFTRISRQGIIDEIYRTNRSIEAITGTAPTTLRPPYGARNNMVLDVAREMDMSVVLWSVDPRDWSLRDAQRVRDHIIDHAIDGSVVLLHDIHESSIEAAIMAVDILIEQGFKLVTVEELFEINAMTLQAGEMYRSIYHTIGGTE